MEGLIRQTPVNNVSPQVAEGHYDLIGPNGLIIPPQLWETTIKPGWTVTMHMWPLLEPPKGPPDGVQVTDVGLGRPRAARRREIADPPMPPMPPPGVGRRVYPPPPPPGWIRVPPGWIGTAGDGEPDIIVIDDNSQIIKSSKKKPKDNRG